MKNKITFIFLLLLFFTILFSSIMAVPNSVPNSPVSNPNPNQIFSSQIPPHPASVPTPQLALSSTCNLFTYSPWSQCNYSALQSRTIISQSPSGCTGGNPDSLIQQCLPPCLESNWQTTDSVCLSSNTLTRTWSKMGNCNQTIGINKQVSENVACTYVPNIITCTNFTYSNWSECFANGIQNRSLFTFSPTDCQAGNPILTQTCNYIAQIVEDNNPPVIDNNAPLGNLSSDVNNNNNNPNKLNQVNSVNNKTQNQTTELGGRKKEQSAIKIFFVKIICKLSNLFNESGYTSCMQNYY